VTAWPTFVLIDHRGVIQHRTHDLEGIEPLVDEVVREAEARAGEASAPPVKRRGDDG